MCYILTALLFKECIRALGRKGHLPFRASKLTQVSINSATLNVPYIHNCTAAGFEGLFYWRQSKNLYGKYIMMRGLICRHDYVVWFLLITTTTDCHDLTWIQLL